MKTQILVVPLRGDITAIYSDDLASLIEEMGGEVDIKRASHVEPTTDGQWTADLSPVGGPVLGPFKLRQVALDEEVKWLQENIL
jgi:hypothetical protein